MKGKATNYDLFVMNALAEGGEPPVFTKPPEAIQSDEEIKLVCNVSVKPEWFKDGVSVRTGDRITIAFDGKQSILTIKKPTTDDQGTYLCISKNEYGEARSTINVMIKKKVTQPEIVTEMKEAVGVEGGEARFEVRFDGHPKPKVEWFHGSEKLRSRGRISITEKDGLYVLIIKDVTASDSGVYKCVATNEAGRRTIESKLTVKEPQISLQFEQSDTKLKQQEVTLLSSFDTKQRRPSQEVQLRIDTGGETEPLSMKPVTTTIVTDVNQTNVIGNEQQFTLTSNLDVKPQPKQEIKMDVKSDAKIEPIVVGKEQQFTLSTSLDTKPKPVSEGIEFTIPGKQLKEEVKISPGIAAKRQEVTLTSSASIDAKPKPTSETVELTIPGKHQEEITISPMVKENVQLPTMLVDKKHEVTTTIDTKARPLSEEIQFTIPNKPKAKPREEKVAEEEVITPMSKEKVDIEPITEDIEVSIAQEPKTELISKPIEPRVAPKFEDNQEAGPLMFDEGEDVNLTTIINAKPEPKISWYKNDKQLRETKNIQLKSFGNKYTLTIKEPKKDDSGLYKCEAKNDSGSVFKTFDVNIKGTSCYFILNPFPVPLHFTSIFFIYPNTESEYGRRSRERGQSVA